MTPDTGRYQNLDASKVRATVDKLKGRIAARFGARGLTNVADELAGLVKQVAQETEASHARLRRAALVAWGAAVVLIVATLCLFAWATHDARTDAPDSTFEWLPLLESGINDLIFVGLAVLFLVTAPERLERARLLAVLHRLRSLAHVIDMHQLAKNPEQAPVEGDGDELSAEQLHHYFDYCSELLSLVAKTAALTAEHTSDSVVLDTVSTLETMTANLSASIWQKIQLLPR